eukprot:2609894-Prymnesium_polylepis.1
MVCARARRTPPGHQASNTRTTQTRAGPAAITWIGSHTASVPSRERAHAAPHSPPPVRPRDPSAHAARAEASRRRPPAPRPTRSR